MCACSLAHEFPIDALAMMRPGVRHELEEARKQHSESKEGGRMPAYCLKHAGICPKSQSVDLPRHQRPAPGACASHRYP